MINNFNKFNFNNFGFNEKLLREIKKLGYVNPTKIQLKCIPLFLKGYNILGIAKTGSGKTAAFVLPILSRLLKKSFLQVLVLTPTRELTIQTVNFFNMFSKYINIKIIPIYGGQSYRIQLNNIKKKPSIIVATPGRLLDLLKKRIINLSSIKTVVLDEADEMLRMGFIEDVKRIFSYIKTKYQMALFSATFSNSIKNIVSKFMNNYKEINLSLFKNKNIVPKNIKQYYLYVNFKNKINILMKFLESENYNSIIIFVKTKIYTIKLSNFILNSGYSSSALNGDMKQFLREKTINNFKNKKISILVATDIASRGLDIKNVDLIINYDLPMDVKSYIHRIGRTGRANNKGKAILFVSKKEKFFIYNLYKKLNCNLKKINIPDNKVILKKRFEKLSFLIKNNKFKKNKITFYKNILSKLLKLNISEKYLDLIFLHIIYKNIYLIK